MKKYWFYGIVHNEYILEENLTDKQKNIINVEKQKLDNENLYNGWLGYFSNNSWRFMRNGFELIEINEEKGNIARKKLKNILSNKFNV